MRILGGFRVFAMLLGSLISNCLCFSSKEYKNYDRKKINGVNYYRKKKRKFNVRRSQKSNRVRNAIVIGGVGIGLAYLGEKYLGKDGTVESDGISEPRLDKREKIDKIQGEVKLSKADEEYIGENFFICKWRDNLCWNNTFIQYLMLPDIRRKSVCSSRIMKVLNWINDKLKEKHTGTCLGIIVDVPDDVRPMAECGGYSEHRYDAYCECCKYENWLKCGKFHSPLPLFFGSYKRDIDEDNIGKYYTNLSGEVIDHETFLRDARIKSCDGKGCLSYFGVEIYDRCGIGEYASLLDMGIHKPFVSIRPQLDDNSLDVVVEVNHGYSFAKGSSNTSFDYEEFFVASSDYFKRFKRFTDSSLNIYDNYLVFTQPSPLLDEDGNNFFNLAPEGYYPTFVSFLDEKSKDFKSCYLVYDNDKKLKFVIYIDTLNNKMVVMSLREIIETMSNSGGVYIRYSRSDIVEKYFVPTR